MLHALGEYIVDHHATLAEDDGVSGPIGGIQLFKVERPIPEPGSEIERYEYGEPLSPGSCAGRQVKRSERVRVGAAQPQQALPRPARRKRRLRLGPAAPKPASSPARAAKIHGRTP